MLLGHAALAWLLGLAAVAWLLGLAASAGAATNARGAWTFASNPALNPPSIGVTVDKSTQQASKGPASEYLFLAPIKNLADHQGFAGEPGPEILEADGTPIWQDPLGQPVEVGPKARKTVAMDFHAAVYAHQPVLVWWQGYITPQGFGDGTWEVASQHYQTLASLHAPAGFETDFHAFEITANGMVYFLANKTVQISLHCCGGPTSGALRDQVVFEADIKTGRIVWSWDPLRHVPLRESYAGIPSSEPWDPYHLNSITVGPGGDLVVSARNTWAAYWIYRTAGTHIGQVFATLGGKGSTFKLGTDVRFAWQHDIKTLPGQQLSVFADEAAPPEAKQSRGEIVALDWAHSSASVVHQYFLPNTVHLALAGSQGNVETLPDGNVFVGWGQLPYFSEYTAAGQLLYLGSLSGSDESYRIYKQPWVGLPQGGPQVIAQPGGNGAVADIDVSWNGATQVVSWQLLAGSSPTALASTGKPVSHQGFEATIATTNPGPYYAVEAIDGANRVLGTSPPVTVSAKTAGKSAAMAARKR